MALKKTKHKINFRNAITSPFHGSSSDIHIFGTCMRCITIQTRKCFFFKRWNFLKGWSKITHLNQINKIWYCSSALKKALNTMPPLLHHRNVFASPQHCCWSDVLRAIPLLSSGGLSLWQPGLSASTGTSTSTPNSERPARSGLSCCVGVILNALHFTSLGTPSLTTLWG